MILIGTMNLTRTRDMGQFYCPTCGEIQDYRLRARRPFLTLYFIPVVPVGGAELFVDCRGCRDKWDVSVLGLDQAQHERIQEEQFHDEAFRATLLVVLADGRISEQEIRALEQLSAQFFGRRIDREELGEMCSVVQQNRIEAGNYVFTVSKRWSESQKRRALQAMFLAATSEGGMGPKQTHLMTRMRDILDLTDQEYQDAINVALEWEPEHGHDDVAATDAERERKPWNTGNWERGRWGAGPWEPDHGETGRREQGLREQGHTRASETTPAEEPTRD